jgi:hypothetical protein
VYAVIDEVCDLAEKFAAFGVVFFAALDRHFLHQI